MIKDGTGQRKMEQGTNEDTGVGYCGLHVTIQLNSVWLLCLWTTTDFQFVILLCCFVHVSYKYIRRGGTQHFNLLNPAGDLLYTQLLFSFNVQFICMIPKFLALQT